MGIDAEMLVRTKKPINELEVRQLAARMVSAFGTDWFMIWNEPDSEWNSHALEIVNIYEQDGPDIKPEPDEHFIRVNLSGRYYGKGYERGALYFYISVANWLEYHIKDAVIYYGGDSSGICAEPFNKASREKLWQYFCEHGHEPYTSYFGSFLGSKNIVVCDFCANKKMTNTGGGGGRTFLFCSGCGKKVVQWSDGHVKVLKCNENFFDVSKERGR